MYFSSLICHNPKVCTRNVWFLLTATSMSLFLSFQYLYTIRSNYKPILCCFISYQHVLGKCYIILAHMIPTIRVNKFSVEFRPQQSICNTFCLLFFFITLTNFWASLWKTYIGFYSKSCEDWYLCVENLMLKISAKYSNFDDMQFVLHTNNLQHLRLINKETTMLCIFP